MSSYKPTSSYYSKFISIISTIFPRLILMSKIQINLLGLDQELGRDSSDRWKWKISHSIIQPLTTHDTTMKP